MPGGVSDVETKQEISMQFGRSPKQDVSVTKPQTTDTQLEENLNVDASQDNPFFFYPCSRDDTETYFSIMHQHHGDSHLLHRFAQQPSQRHKSKLTDIQ